MKYLRKYPLLLLWSSWKVYLTVCAALAGVFLEYKPSFAYAKMAELIEIPFWIKRFANFDGFHYAWVAEKGYKGIGLATAYFPLYPLFGRYAAPVTQPFLFATTRVIQGIVLCLLIVSAIASFLVLVSLARYLRDRYDQAFILKVLLVLVTFPTSFIFHAAYNESLFLLFALLSFWTFRRTQLWLTAFFIACASATRLVGVFLIPAFALHLLWEEFFRQWQRRNDKQSSTIQRALRSLLPTLQKHFVHVAVLSLGITGLLSYMFYLWRDFQDPLYFFHVQSEFGAGRQESLVLFPQVVWRYLKILATARPFDLKYFAYVQEFFFTLSAGAALVWGIIKRKALKLEISELAFSVCAFILPTLTGTFSSMPRYI